MKSVLLLFETKVCFAVVSTAALICLSASPSQGAGTMEVWTIKQQSCTFGDIEVLVNESAFRWKNPKSGLTITTHGPAWRFFAYNDVNKKFMLLTAADIKQMINRKEGQANSKSEKWPLISGTSTMAGIPVVRMIIPSHGEVPKAVAMKIYAAAKANKKLDAAQTKLVDKSLKEPHEEYWVAKNIAVPAGAMSLLPFKNPGDMTPHVFIRTLTASQSGVTRTTMDTQSVKRSKVSADAFDPPSGYKKADTQMALFVDNSEFDDFVPQPRHK